MIFCKQYSSRTIAHPLVILFFLLILSPVMTHAKAGFAVVIDSLSYQKANTEVNAYVQALERLQDFRVYVVVDRWHTPHGIKAELKRLHSLRKDAIVGAVFIGDIPIAMLRDAQRLTSAFKMNQKADWKESSVPSDRYYEDFGIDFKLIKKDATAPYFYYALAPTSRAYLACDIFSGRIRPTDFGGVSRYEKLRRYLRKVVAWKEQQHPLRQVLFFSGHGYVSESITARVDEAHNLYEHFPRLSLPGNSLRYIDFRQQRPTKFTLMNALQQPTLDLALLHHHGAPDIQYLDDADPVSSPEDAQRYLQAYGRGYLRKQVARGENQDSVLKRLSKRFNTSNAWFDNAFQPKVRLKDSVSSANTDLLLQDFKTYHYAPNARMVVLDACFNGSFHLDSCIAGEYIFNEGQTIVCIANSVNVLQDKWSDHYLGLMGEGGYAGNYTRLSGYLESHCLGDPTFTFPAPTKQVDINQLIDATSVKQLSAILKNHPHPDVASIALMRLVALKGISSKELLHIVEHNEHALLRLQALTLLSGLHTDDFEKALAVAAFDDNEMVERTALNMIGKAGYPSLATVLIEKMMTPDLSPRCVFSCQNALSFYDQESLKAAFHRCFETKKQFFVQPAQTEATYLQQIIDNANKWNETITLVLNDKAPIKKRLQAVRTTRNYCPHRFIPQLIACAESTKDEALKIAIIESLGWRSLSVYRPMILDFAKKIVNNEQASLAVKNEAQQTIEALQ